MYGIDVHAVVHLYGIVCCGVLLVVAGIVHARIGEVGHSHGCRAHDAVGIYAPSLIADEVIILVSIHIHLQVRPVVEGCAACGIYIRRVEHHRMVNTARHGVFHIQCLHALTTAEGVVGNAHIYPLVCLRAFVAVGESEAPRLWLRGEGVACEVGGEI